MKVILRSESERQHNLSIETQEFDVDVEPGETITLLVTFPPRGTLVFVCKYHVDKGMAGTLVAT